MKTRSFPRSALILALAGLGLATAARGDDPAPGDEGFRNVIIEVRKALPDARLRMISITDEGEERGYWVEARRGREEFRLRLTLEARLVQLSREGPVSDKLRAAVLSRLPQAQIREAVRHEIHAERRLIRAKKSRRGTEVVLRQGSRRAVVVFQEDGQPRNPIEWGSIEDEDEEDGEDGDEEELDPEDRDEDGDEESEGDEGEEGFDLEVEELALVTRELSRRFPGARLIYVHREEAYERPILVCGLEGKDGGRAVFIDAESRQVWRVEKSIAGEALPEAVRSYLQKHCPEAQIEGAAAIEDFCEPGWAWLDEPRIVHEARIEREGRSGAIILDAQGRIIEGPFWDGDNDEDEDEGDEDEGEEGEEDEGEDGEDQ